MAYSLLKIRCSAKACIYVILNNDFNFLTKIKGHYPKDYKKLIRYLERFASEGKILDENKYKHIEGNVYEFKTDKLRVLCLQLPGRVPKTIILNHYYKKQKQKSSQKDLDKAIRISSELIDLHKKGEIKFGD